MAMNNKSIDWCWYQFPYLFFTGLPFFIPSSVNASITCNDVQPRSQISERTDYQTRPEYQNRPIYQNKPDYQNRNDHSNRTEYQNRTNVSLHM